MLERIILFDGVCNLCNSAVNFVIDHDPKGRFRFAALQSDFGIAEMKRLGPRDDLMESIVLLEGDRAFTRSSAALRIARGLGFPWSMALVFWVVPRPLRDWAYDVVARNRYRWFGRRKECRVPTPELKARFVE